MFSSSAKFSEQETAPIIIFAFETLADARGEINRGMRHISNKSI